jgi:hypothetical protein
MKTFSMPRVCAAVALAVGATVAVHAADTSDSVAVMSLVGDEVEVVTYEGQTGRLTDANPRKSVPFADAQLDLVALKAAGEAAQAADPQATVALLSASTPALFSNQEKWFEGDHVRLPAEITAAVEREHAARLLLVTKYRGEARIRLSKSVTGSGRLEGMGFYVDPQTPLRRGDTGEWARGYLAPYAYIEASLIDVASNTVLRQTRIAEAYAISSARSKEDRDPWNALTTPQKVKAMRGLLDHQLREAVPPLFAQHDQPSRPE